jgi:DNA-binding CsgD family transcriptional regulator
MERHKSRSEIINKYAADNRIEIAKLQLANQENISEISSLQKEKNRIMLIRNFSIALILALSAFGYLYLNRIRLQSRLKQQEAVEAKRQAELETALAKEQLNIFTESLREKTQQMEELRSRSLEKEQHREQIEQMQELTTYTILTDEDWERFKNLFIKVYPGFFVELKQHVPDITLAEQRMAALIKLHVPNKDAAGMLGISHNSIYKTRQRLRQRLGFEKDEEMDVFFREGPLPPTP